MRIKKVSETTPIQAQVVDSLDGNSTTDAPSVHAVNSGLSDLIKTQTFSRSITQSANTIDWWQYNTSINIPTGYSILGLVMKQCPSNNWLVAINYNDNTVYIKIDSRMSSSSETNTITCTMLYIKNS